MVMMLVGPCMKRSQICYGQNSQIGSTLCRIAALNHGQCPLQDCTSKSRAMSIMPGSGISNESSCCLQACWTCITSFPQCFVPATVTNLDKQLRAALQ